MQPDGGDDVVRDLRTHAGSPAGRAGGRHRGRRRVGRAVRVVLSMLLVAAVVGGARHVATGGPGRRPVVAAPPAASWRAVIEQLDATRVRAWTSSAPSTAADVAGSPVARADAATAAALRRAGVVPRGFALRLEAVDVVSTGPARAELRVVDSRRPYTLVRGDGSVFRRVEARGPRAWTVRLLRIGRVWRFVSAAPFGR